MNSSKNRDDELRRREKELQDREQALRLRELEAEINQPPSLPTTKHGKSERTLKHRYRQVLNLVQFVGIVIAVVIAVRIATGLATVVMMGGIAWIVYKVFFQTDRRKP